MAIFKSLLTLLWKSSVWLACETIDSSNISITAQEVTQKRSGLLAHSINFQQVFSCLFHFLPLVYLYTPEKEDLKLADVLLKIEFNSFHVTDFREYRKTSGMK